MEKSDKKIITINDKYNYEVIHLSNRIVYKPNYALFFFQRIILRMLKSSFPLSINLFDSAIMHCNKKWILKMDIRHFFESIPLNLIEEQLKTVVNNTKSYTLEALKEGVLINNKLVAGASTSPHIANACMKNIDASVREHCKTEGVEYSRYMDDLFFSGNDKESLENVQKFVIKLLNKYGFEINDQKTKFVPNSQRQVVLGMIVNNEKPALTKETKSKIRAILYQYMTEKTDDFETLNGYLSYTYCVDKLYFKKLYEYYKTLKIETGKTPLQRRFISKMFKHNIRAINTKKK